MRRHLINPWFICLAGLPIALAAQTPAPAQAPTQPAVQTGSQQTAASRQSRFTPRFPVYATVEGQPIDPRPPEKSDDTPLFSGQTRAPYHATAPYKVTTLTSALRAPWALAFLPDGSILITERLPGALRILDKQGGLSEPLPGLPALSTVPETGLLDVALDPNFAANHRI